VPHPRTRREQLQRRFKLAILAVTSVIVLGLLAGTSHGRYASRWAVTRSRWAAMRVLGRSIDHAEVEAEWQYRRLYDIEQTRTKLEDVYDQYSPKMKGLLDYAGLDPAHALLRWGNFEKTLLLPSTVFEPDDSGRSYRFRPSVRSIWVRNLMLKGGILAYFSIPDGPKFDEAVDGTGALVVKESLQSTNSWGLRGGEPNVEAALRGIVLGDSYMQGLFVGDDDTPSENLKRYLKDRLRTTVEVLNTGHLGYSPEQEYYTLVEYARKFPPQFVILSLFANDAGDLFEVLEGRADWEENRHWIGRIDAFCQAEGIPCLVVPAPWVNQIDGPRRAGYYPGAISNILEGLGVIYFDPFEEFAVETDRLAIQAIAEGKPTLPNPLFNGNLADGHFSALGCRLWGDSVGRRLALILERRRVQRESKP